MNFLTRNLGWLLLLLFFIFMLFVISTNDQTKNLNNTTSLSGSIDANNTTPVNPEDELSKLIERVDKAETEENISDEANMQTGTGEINPEEKKGGFFSFLNREEKAPSETNTENIGSGETLINETNDNNTEENSSSEEKSETGTGETIEEASENKSLFDRLFGKKEITENEDNTTENESEAKKVANENENQEETKTQDTDTTEKKTQTVTQAEKQNAGNIQVQTPIQKSTIQNVDGNLSKSSGTPHMLKNASHSYMHQYPKEVQDSESKIMYPGLDLETAVGKQFEVGVHMLKLNNANFDVKLALMNRGDRLEQLTKENQYGCFMIEIRKAQNPQNIGKKGYVCKKYLTEVSSDLKSYNTPTHASHENKEVIKVPVLEISESEKTPVMQVSPETESFLPAEKVLIEKRIVENKSTFSEDAEALQKNSNKIISPKDPIILDSSNSFLPAE